GAVMGTPAYMAPEQAEGAPDVGPPADVYSLGVILYHLLTGRVPFKSDSLVELLHQVCTAEPVPPGRVRAGVPAVLEAVCLAWRRKKPQARPTAADLAARLEAFAGEPVGEGTTVALPRVSRRPRWAFVVAGGVAAVLAVAALAWGLWPGGGERPREES